MRKLKLREDNNLSKIAWLLSVICIVNIRIV